MMDRHDIEWRGDEFGLVSEKCAAGDWVRYEDAMSRIADLERQRDELVALIEERIDHGAVHYSDWDKAAIVTLAKAEEAE